MRRWISILPTTSKNLSRDSSKIDLILCRGLVGVGGLVPSSVLKQTGVADGELSLVFGSVGFFGYGYMTSSPDAVDRHLPYKPVEPGPYAVWWSTFELEKCPDWRSLDKEDAQRQLVERHSFWKNPTIQKIVESVKVDRMWPSWTIPPLPTWERNGVVLVGDAAHALQSTSGQGASQALEDSESFALLLGHYMRWAYRHPKATQVESEGEAQELAAKKFEDLRMPHVQMIYDRSQMTANSKKRLPVWKEFLVYFMLWLVGELPRPTSSSPRPTGAFYTTRTHIPYIDLSQESSSSTTPITTRCSTTTRWRKFRG